MKYCEKFAALLDPYVDGELTEEEAVRVREHLESCPGCQSYVDGALAIRAAFPEAEETALPEGFAQGVMDALRELETAKAEKVRPGTRRYGQWKTVLLPLAACFALVLVLRTVSGGESGNASVTTADMALPSAMDTAVPAGDSGEYGSAAPRMAAAGDVPAEADSEEVPELRTAMAEPSPDASAPVAGGVAPQAEAVPQTGEGMDVIGTAGKLSGWKGRAIRLTAAQAGELLAELSYTAGEDGVRCYQLPSADFDALLAALAERDIMPSEEEVPKTEDAAEGYDLVYVTEE